MQYLKYIQYFLLFFAWIRSAVIKFKEKDLKEKKDAALESGDQRNFEESFNSDSVSGGDNSVSDNYDKLYERTSKGKN